MILSFSYQLKLFITAVSMGIVLGAAYSGVYIFSKKAHTPQWAKGILDIVYWICAAFFIFLTMLKINKGEIRPFVIFALGAGMIFYCIYLKNFFETIICAVFNILYRVFLLIVDIILTPIRLVLYPFNIILTKIIIFFKKHLKIYVKYEKITLYRLIKYFMGVTELTEAAAKKKHSKMNILWALMMIITICIFAAALCYQYIIHLQLDTAKQEIEVQIAEAKAESAALTKQYENQDSPEFIEKIAREKLNMVYPSELVYINTNSDEGKNFLNSIKRSSVRAAEAQKDQALEAAGSNRVE